MQVHKASDPLYLFLISLQSEPTLIKKQAYDETGLRRSTKTKDGDGLTSLLRMGFSRSSSLQALQVNDSDVDRAVSYLLDSSTKAERDLADTKSDSLSKSGDLYATVNSAQAEDTQTVTNALVGRGFHPQAVRYALQVFDSDIEMAQDWLLDPSNAAKIETLITEDAMEIETGGI